MKVSIIGAGRTRNGIGEYLSKYFHKYGGKIISILGTSRERSDQTSMALQKYGINAKPYIDFDEMIRMERPEVLVIASPSYTHYEYLRKGIDLGLHLFCEKPFIWDGFMDLRKEVENIFEKAYQRGLTIAMNSQWPFSIEAYEALCGKIIIQQANTFYIHLSPPCRGKEMIPESVPHALSLLYCFLGTGEIEDLNFEFNGQEEMKIRFSYLSGAQTCDVLIHLKYLSSLPRPFAFGLNDRIVYRSVDLEDYKIYFNYEDKRLRIVDPLELSVRNFMEAIEKRREPYIGYLHILHNVSLLKEIREGYHEFEKSGLWKD